jgi:hypothetical protein
MRRTHKTGGNLIHHRPRSHIGKLKTREFDDAAALELPRKLVLPNRRTHERNFYAG